MEKPKDFITFLKEKDEKFFKLKTIYSWISIVSAILGGIFTLIGLVNIGQSGDFTVFIISICLLISSLITSGILQLIFDYLLDIKIIRNKLYSIEQFDTRYFDP